MTSDAREPIHVHDYGAARIPCSRPECRETLPEEQPVWTAEQKRQWTPEQEQRETARAAYMFLNMARCGDCGLPWPEGYVHFDCPAAEGGSR